MLKEVLNEKRILNNKCKKRIFEKKILFFISKFFQIKRFSMIFLGGIFMNVKAIMCDIDGTLLSNDGVVAPKTVEMIKKAREQRILFGLSTGRDVNRIQTLLKSWGIDGLVDMIVGTGGAEIYDYTLDLEKEQYPLDGRLIKSIIKHYEDMDCHFVIPEDGILFAPKDDEHIQMLSKADKVPYQVVNYDEFLQNPKPKLIINCKPEDMDKIIERSKTFHSDEFKSSSHKTASVLYEYMDPRVSKTAGLIEILKLHHIDIKEIVTFGDADNDYDMTLNAGVGVVMANGSDKTKSVADYITDDNDHDGIEKFILGEQKWVKLFLLISMEHY